MTLFVASIPLLDSFSASKDACVASDSQSFQVALDEVGPGFLPVSYQRVTSPVPSSSGADFYVQCLDDPVLLAGVIMYAVDNHLVACSCSSSFILSFGISVSFSTTCLQTRNPEESDWRGSASLGPW